MFQKLRNFKRDTWERYVAGKAVDILEIYHGIPSVIAQRNYDGEPRWGTYTAQYGIFTPVDDILKGRLPDA